MSGSILAISALAGTLLFAAQCGSHSQETRENERFSGKSESNNTKYSEVNREIGEAKPKVMEVPLNYIASQGEMLLCRSGKKLALPLMHTDVVGSIEGFLARVHVTQKFINSFDSTIEALYTFPLPENSAVDSMIMVIGKKRIRGIIKERGEARAMYEQARHDGKTASLLEQERPNIFTQSIANILPNDTIQVEISYVQELKYRGGCYTFNFPMIVGPRYIPGNELKPEEQGTVYPTDQVSDAHRITPPIIPPEMRSGHTISLSLYMNAGIELKAIGSPSHKIKITNKTEKTCSVEILPNDQIPNKDFMLEYRVAGNELENIILFQREKENRGFIQLIMVPKISVEEQEIFPRELVFVVDNSGSMMGEPIEKCKEIMKLCLKNMRKDDLFRVIKFSGSTDIMSPVSLPATEANVKKALQYVDKMSGGGGTEMMKAINAIFDSPETPGRKMLVLFLTDGFVGNESMILSTIRDRLGSSRVFSVGVGSSINHYLLEGMAHTGRGVCTVIRQDGEAEKVLKEFYSLIDAPVLTDIRVKWKNIETSEPQPAAIPDLFQGQPLVITAKYSGRTEGEVIVSGNLPGGRAYKKNLQIKSPNMQNCNSIISTLWARQKIHELSLSGNRIFGEMAYEPQMLKEQIVKLGLEYRIMTQYTSFVAVDDAIRNKHGKWITMEQALEMPEGVSPLSQPPERFAADIFGKGGYASFREKKRGVLGLNKGIAGAGYGSGYGGGTSGVDDLIGSIMGGGSETVNMRSGGTVKIASPEFTKGGMLTGSRSKGSVMRVVMQNLAALRYAYNKRLRDKPGLNGKVTVKFTIDEFGKVIFCAVVNSTMNDVIFEQEVVEKIKRWVFEKIEKPGDVTEIVYPFVFSE